MASRSSRARWAILVALVGWVLGAARAEENQNQPKPRPWAFQPITRPVVPSTFPPGVLVRNPIDAFILARLGESGLSASPEADRRTMIRRLYFDLIGLPPAWTDVAEFQNERQPDAYEKLTERLLNSPRHGERWARHWLDVVRFAETHGFEMNQPRVNAWPYRDYVIRAFNDDKPYDRFVMEQIAGDVLGADEATGFLVGGPWDQVKSPDVVLTSNQRADELHDVVGTTGSAFLGLTVGCARCHHHKFDPIPQPDYYALKAAFAGVQHGEREPQTAEIAARKRETMELRDRLAELEQRLSDFEPLASFDASKTSSTNSPRPAVHPRRNVERFAPVTARRLRFTVTRTTDAEPCLDELEVFTSAPNARNIALASQGVKARASGVYPNSEIHRLEHINDGAYGNGRSWISSERGAGWVELEFPEEAIIDKVVWSRDREEKFKDRLAVEYHIEVSATGDDWKLAASSRDRRPYPPDPKVDGAIKFDHLGLADQSLVRKLLTERERCASRLKELTGASLIYAGKFTVPEAIRRFHRGDPMLAREAVEPGALTAIPVRLALENVPGGTQLSEDQRRRLALARWIVHPANPLTARVMVNRVWQYHFGEGLVSTPSDFGANGAAPTHRELLDWLAAEFMEHDWSIRHIHRLIVKSATYRQASAPRPDAMAIDAGSRLLWRFPPRRLEAEPIRDTILAVCGTLDCRMGGPGFAVFEPNDNYVRVYDPLKAFGPAEWRRMIYMTKVRMQQDGTFGAFDCPDGGQIAPKRSRSTTPLQALNLLNSNFILQQAEFFADRLRNETGTDAVKQAREAFRIAFNREPVYEELSAAVEMIRAEGLRLFCRALLNANEFVYVF